MIAIEHNVELHLAGSPADWIAADVPSWPVRKLKLRAGNPAGGILFAGPWIGEFGWELARWQGAVRRRARESGLYTIVMSHPGHHVLYECADEFWELPQAFLEATLTRQCDHVRAEDEASVDLLTSLGASLQRELRAYSLTEHVPGGPLPKRAEQDFVRLRAPEARWSDAVSRPYCCLIVRGRSWCANKNWPPASWRELAARMDALGYGHAVLGSRGEVAALDSETRIAADEGLARSVDLLAHAHFAVAGESGGAILALLCGTRTVVFGRADYRERITEDWNPLKTPVRYVETPDFTVTPEEVACAACEFMC